jgi:hypothetical protein
MSSPNWLYLRSEEELWTVGFYDGDGKWRPESDHGSAAEAARRVTVLNGGTPQPAYVPALIHGRKSTLWVHGCGHVEAWPTDPKYPPIENEGCDACESAPDGTWRQLYVEVPDE